MTTLLACGPRASSAPVAHTRSFPVGSEHPLVNASDLNHFADRRPRAAQELLPHIICRLLSATPGVEGLVAPSGDGIITRGWDICVDDAPASPFVPGGSSRWELSTNAEPQKKATTDYTARKKNPQSADPSETTEPFSSCGDLVVL